MFEVVKRIREQNPHVNAEEFVTVRYYVTGMVLNHVYPTTMLRNTLTFLRTMVQITISEELAQELLGYMRSKEDEVGFVW
jgi:hypothetical protein